jgi:hypothetical protein
MLVAVDFDDEFRRQTAEVSDEAADWHLPSEMRALNGKAMAQVPPEPLLRLGLGSAQGSAARALPLRRRFRLVLSPG